MPKRLIEPDLSLFPPENPSFAFRFKSYVLIAGLITPIVSVFMNVFNRTRITGKENLRGLGHKWILAPNHLTLLDDLFIGPLVIFPNSMRGYRYFPYHAPEQTNFYKKPVVSWFMRQSKSIPLIRGNGIRQEGMERLIQAVNDGGILQIYPEGTRSRTGEIGQGKPGVGRIACETGAPVVPVYYQGLEKILPIGVGVPRIGNEIRVSIGKPLYFKPCTDPEHEFSTWRDASREIIEAIKAQKKIADDLWGEMPIVIKQQASKE